jgi:hypothetical protein
MSRKLISTGLFVASMAAILAVSPQFTSTAFGQKKAEPIKTDELFKKLDTNKDKLLGLDEFKRLFDVQPEPKAKKGKEREKFDLEFIFKSLDANGDKMLSADEFKGVIGAIFPAPKK